MSRSEVRLAWLLVVVCGCLINVGCLALGENPPARHYVKLQPDPTPESLPARPVQISVTLVRQMLSNWCWAASAEMVGRFYRQPWTQCDQVQTALPNTVVCQDGAPNSGCNTTGWPFFTDHFGFQEKLVQVSNDPLAWSRLVDEVQAGHPMCYAYLHQGFASGHMVVIVGAGTLSHQPVLYINNPSNPSRKNDVQSWREYNSDFHWRTYWNIMPK